MWFKNALRVNLIISAHTHTHTHVPMHARTHAHTYTHTTRAHTHIHKHTHTQTHTLSHTHERSIPHLLASRMSESASTNTFRSMSLRSSLLANASIPSNMITLAPYIVLWVAKPNMCTWSLITIAISVIKNQNTNTIPSW